MAPGPPERTREYRNHHLDSTRWDQFVARDDDIVITTAYKAGTTWTQRILAALLLGPGPLPLPLGDLSPWIDARTSVSAPLTLKPFSSAVSKPRIQRISESRMLPVVLVAVIVVAFSTVAAVAATPPIATVAPPMKFVPVIVTPVPPNVEPDDPELFGFWTYELRVGHNKIWSIAQARFGRPLEVKGKRHGVIASPLVGYRRAHQAPTIATPSPLVGSV